MPTKYLIAFLLVCAASCAAFTGQAAPPDVFAIMAEFDRITTSPLWPGFEPQRIPVEIYDGYQTWLFRHPHPPEDFKESAQHPGVFVATGRHPSVTANTSIQLGGVGTATVMLPGNGQPLRESAALIVHECFHVFQREHHPKWTANEVDLFTYPVDDPALLQSRFMETEALRRALASQDSTETACWAAEAVRIRHLRFTELPASAAAYERGTELNEGLANYLQIRAAGTAGSFSLPPTDFLADAVRLRAYQTGAALALLLDRLSPGWQTALDSGSAESLDELLEKKVYYAAVPCQLGDVAEASLLVRARTQISALKERRTKLRAEFLSAKGWQIVVTINPQHPLFPQDFDPWNITVLGRSEVLHQRHLKLGNDDGIIEILDQPSLTLAAGSHPLFNGVRQVTITGLKSQPTLKQNGSSIQLTAAGVQGDFHYAVAQTKMRTVRIEVGER